MKEMTSRERVLAVLLGKEHDRVPYMELYIDEIFARRLLGLPPVSEPTPMSGSAPITCAYFGGHSYDPLDLARAMDLDGLCMSLQPQIYFDVSLSDGQYFVVGGKIHESKDLKNIQLYDPDDESIYQPAREFIERFRSHGYAIGCFINLGSDPVILSMGWDHFSYALYDNPGLVETLFDQYSDWFSRAVQHICRLGFDFIWAGDDIAFKSGPMISPKVFRQIFMPYYRRVAEKITIPWIFHTDGNFLPVLDDLLSLGMHALHPIEPDAVDILEVKRMVMNRVALIGNIDINLLSTGTVEEVESITRDTLQRVGRDGRFILSSSNSITRSCKVENVLGMIRACRYYGIFPGTEGHLRGGL